jgi:death-on-curing protein
VKETVYLTLEESLTLHAELIRRFGGLAGVRDPGLLESVLARPRSGYYKSLSEQAAALLHSLISNHCFVDGNKRMAFAAAAIFLHMNGFQFQVDAEAGETFLIDRVIKARAELAEIRNWIEEGIVPVPVEIKDIHKDISKRHRKSLDKLGP